MFKKTLIIASIICMALFLHSCSNMHLSGGVGMNFSGGPYGVKVTPSMNVGLYGGGYRW
ncbi:hypothetical protein AAGF08_05555 [Algoriphagus sp. SE2]|uniref:hypothetical protein n=1 Tax=Algoriphagus sp. SE2 TaxID=3141536 RepID=UPI0031CD0A82